MAIATIRHPKQFLTIAEIAQELQISERSARDLVASGQIRAIRLGQRLVRIPRVELERLAQVAGDTERTT